MKKMIKTGNVLFAGSPLFQKPKSDRSADTEKTTVSDASDATDAHGAAGTLAEKGSDVSGASASAVPQPDDTELVAVIAAAIATSEQIPIDGFVVRTIRKRR